MPSSPVIAEITTMTNHMLVGVIIDSKIGVLYRLPFAVELVDMCIGRYLCQAVLTMLVIAYHTFIDLS